MAMRIFALFDEDGRPKGFYPNDVWPSRPQDAVEISPDDWREFCDYQGKRRWDGSKVVEYIPPPAPPIGQQSPDRVMSETMLELAKETAAMNEAIVSAVRAWADLENSLAYLLGTIITQGGGSLGMAIYHTPSATETRIAIVDEALTHFLSSHPNGDVVEPYRAILMKRIGRCKGTRNKIIHGNVVTVAMGGRKQRTRLMAQIFNMASSNNDRARMIANASAQRRGDSRSQLVGMSTHDVQQAANNFGRLSAAANALRLVISHMQRVTPSPEAFRKKVLELSAHLPIDDDPPKDDPTTQDT
jgi:hypothetical protein